MTCSRLYCLALCLFVAFPVLALADDKKPNEVEGTWTITALTIDGNQLGTNDVQQVPNVVITSDKFEVGGKTAASYTISPDGTPKFVDLRLGETPEKADVSEGIYRLEDDTLTICLRPAGGVKERPTEFESKTGSGRILVVLKRVK